jgi:hypothetical protein
MKEHFVKIVHENRDLYTKYEFRKRISPLVSNSILVYVEWELNSRVLHPICNIISDSIYRR